MGALCTLVPAHGRKARSRREEHRRRGRGGGAHLLPGHIWARDRAGPLWRRPAGDRGTEALQGWGLEAGCYLLFVGRLVPENGAHDYLEGARRAGLDIPAVVVGDATYAEEYKASLRAIAPQGSVLTGYQFGAAYQQLSSHAGMFVLAATVGGTHPVLVEQMAAGNAILARETDSNREVLGDAGLYWSTGEELAGLLRTTWADEKIRRRWGEAARARAAELYDWEQVTTRYVELCERSLA